MILASERAPAFPRGVAATWRLLGAALVGYALLLAFGPALQSIDGLVVQVIGQKVIALTLTLGLVYLESATRTA